MFAAALAMAGNIAAVSGNAARCGTTAAVSAADASGMRNCVVHRGDGVRGLPENSLEAALKAWGSGFMPLQEAGMEDTSGKSPDIPDAQYGSGHGHGQH